MAASLPPNLSTKGAAAVEHVLFFATHELSNTDTRLFRHYARQLRDGVTLSALWVALFDQCRGTAVVDAAASEAVGGGVWVWGDGTLRIAMPRLAESNDSHIGSAQEPVANHRRYYYFLASLSLWNQSLGHHYPRLAFMWRIEPDVLFSGSSWDALLRRVDRQSERPNADLLLPRVMRFRADPNFPHFSRNLDVLKGVPKAAWCRSLVSIGRYSARFMAHMTARWTRGEIGYEEVFLPTVCMHLGDGGCRLASMHNVTKLVALRMFSEDPPIKADHFRYLPELDCEEVVRAAEHGIQHLWHPVKRRECFLSHLDRVERLGRGVTRSISSIERTVPTV